MRLSLMVLLLGLMARPAVAQIGGCFDSDVGPWTPAETEEEVEPMALPNEAGDSLSYSFPPRIRVDSGGTFSIPAGALPTVHQTMRWEIVGGVLHFLLDWQKGYVGLRGSLETTETGWVGYAQTYTHKPGLQRYRQRLVLREVSCDTPPPVPASADTPLPLRIHLSDGRAFALGPVPDGSNLSEGLNEPILGDDVAVDGYYSGATRVVVRVEDGVISRMAVYFDDGGTRSVLDRLAREFGERTGLLRSWSNRTGTILGDTDPGVRILLHIQPSGLNALFPLRWTCCKL